MDLLLQALAGAHDLGQPPDDHREAAANLGLNPDRNDQQAQIVLGHTLEHLFHRARQRQAEPRLLDRGAEFGAIGSGNSPPPLAIRAAANVPLRATT